MTEKQRKILLFITDFINTHGYPPSYQEICYALKIKSKSQVFEFVKRLKEQGHIKTVTARKRSMSVVHQDKSDIILKEKLSIATKGLQDMADGKIPYTSFGLYAKQILEQIKEQK